MTEPYCARCRFSNQDGVSLFEYLIAGISLVLALGVVRLLDGFSSLLESERRYWPHSLWVVIKFVNHFTVWWVLWALSDEAVHWNFALFSLLLVTPVILYLQSTALVSALPTAIEDWRSHFYRVRRRFFALNVLFGASMPIVLTAFGMDLGVASWAVALIIMVVSASCFYLDSHRVQAVSVLLLLALSLFLILRIVFAPPSLGAFAV